MGKQLDERPPLQRALGAVAGVKAGSWESVEALALLAIEAKGLPECTSLRDAAHAAAAGLKSGTWEHQGPRLPRACRSGDRRRIARQGRLLRMITAMSRRTTVSHVSSSG